MVKILHIHNRLQTPNHTTTRSKRTDGRAVVNVKFSRIFYTEFLMCLLFVKTTTRRRKNCKSCITRFCAKCAVFSLFFQLLPTNSKNARSYKRATQFIEQHGRKATEKLYLFIYIYIYKI